MDRSRSRNAVDGPGAGAKAACSPKRSARRSNDIDIRQHIENVCDSDHPKSFGTEQSAIPSAAETGIGRSRLLTDCIITAGQPIHGLKDVLEALDAQIEVASVASALAGCRRVWRNGRRLPIDDEGRDEVAEAAASNDFVLVGCLLGPRDVNTVACTNLPETIVRRPKSCVLLDVAVGAGAVEVSKCLLEFHGAKPTRETLKMAIAIGNLELIRLIWARLPDEQHSRGDLLEVAADFHRGEPLRWLFRDSHVGEQELFFVDALEAHFADGLLEVLGERVRPWWWRTRR
jgi:hypothetical protein